MILNISIRVIYIRETDLVRRVGGPFRDNVGSHQWSNLAVGMQSTPYNLHVAGVSRRQGLLRDCIQLALSGHVILSKSEEL